MKVNDLNSLISSNVFTVDYMAVILTQQVSSRWQSSSCCSACGSLWFCAAGSPGVSRCGGHCPGALRRGLPARRLLQEPVLLCACHPPGMMCPGAGGPESQSGWIEERSSVLRPQVALASDFDSYPGTAAGPRRTDLPLHPLSFHLLRPSDCN